MLTFLHYALMLWVGFFFYRHGQKLLNQGHRDNKGEPTQGMVGPVGFLVMGAAAGYLWFALLGALVRGQVPNAGKGCAGQIYTLAEQAERAGPYRANVFFLAWCVLAFGYAPYVRFQIWFRPQRFRAGQGTVGVTPGHHGPRERRLARAQACCGR
ncbi:hypothetical protein OIN59_08960 [Acidovorax sp. D2M1]|uniref:Uncharacterized protein n=1 Tax=Acidovorax benzenivorans TaxID=2987520 RepID=A0ABT5RV45_9BURK|nr:hypothetical protein [Acidovorax benzenivorans]MDD2177564.1 hypothetical protein [Acidovorax benzenivorans]